MSERKKQDTPWGWIYEEWSPSLSASRSTGSSESSTNSTLGFTARDMEALTECSATLITDGLAIYPTVSSEAYANGEAAKRVSTLLPLHVDLLGLTDELTRDEQRIAFAVVDLLGLFRLWRRHMAEQEDLNELQVVHDSVLEAVAKHAYIAASPLPPRLSNEQTKTLEGLIESCRKRHSVLPSHGPSRVLGVESVSPKTPPSTLPSQRPSRVLGAESGSPKTPPSTQLARAGKSWTKEEAQLCDDLLEQGLTNKEIAHRLQRTPSAINYRREDWKNRKLVNPLEERRSSSPTGAARQFCGNCGERTVSETKFCIYCGADQDRFDPANKS